MLKIFPAFLTVVIIATVRLEILSANACGPVTNVGEYLISKTSNLNTTYSYETLAQATTLTQCAILCFQRFEALKVCNAITMDSGVCCLTNIAQESYSNFDQYSTASHIYVIENYAFSTSNYRLFAIGSSTSPGFSQFFGARSQNSLAYTNQWVGDTLLGNVINFVDHIGATFNFVSRFVLVCGGLQVLGSLNISSNCWYLKTDPKRSTFTGPVQMLQPREYPNLVSSGMKIYIYGGLVTDTSQDIVEVFDPSTLTISKVGTGPAPTQLTGLTFSCGITLNDQETFVVTGGSINNIQQSSTGFININSGTWSSMGNMNNARSYHGCAKVLRKGRDFLMVYGGSQSSIELLDFSNRQSSWNTSPLSLPSSMAKIPGHVATVFDDQNCEMLFIEITTQMLYACSGNYSWIARNIAAFLPNGTIPFITIDASSFGPYFA